MLAAGCGSQPAAKPAAPLTITPYATPLTRHPYNKHLEICAFRVSESKPGRLKVRFLVVNHSQAEMGDLKLKIQLVTSKAGPDDPPVGELDAEVKNLAPESFQEVSAVLPTKLKVYEIPDWQFLRAAFTIVAPKP